MKYKPLLFGCVVLLFLCLVGALVRTPPVLASTTIIVNTTDDELNNDGDCSLREAIQAANLDVGVDACPAGSGDDTILLPSGMYTLTIPGIDEDAAATGDLDITSTVVISATGATSPLIDGNSLDRVFHVISPITVTISGLTIQNGVGGGGGGGGILNNATLTVLDSTVANNTGGGIKNSGTLTLVNSTIISNTGGFGGGIYDGGTGGGVTLINSTVSSNTGLIGGGIYSFVTRLVLTNTTISNNTGGGLYNSVGPGAVISNSAIISNTGTGIFAASPTTIANSTIISNTGTGIIINNGGAGMFAASPITITNSTISGNQTTESGGGLSVIGVPTVTANLNNVTITNNIADSDNTSGGDGGGIYISGAHSVNIQNTILAGNSDLSGGGADCFGTLTSQGYNLIQTTAGCTISGTTTGNLIGVNPNLGPLQDNGGPTLTHALLPGSPAIDRGSPATPGSGGNACEATDQRGQPRPQGTRCDMGAYESNLTVIEYLIYLPLIMRNP